MSNVWKKAAIVEPVVLHNGFIVGSWRPVLKTDPMIFRVHLYCASASSQTKSLLRERAKWLSESFFNKKGFEIEYVDKL